MTFALVSKDAKERFEKSSTKMEQNGGRYTNEMLNRNSI